jgi:hypothetical protein
MDPRGRIDSNTSINSAGNVDMGEGVMVMAGVSGTSLISALPVSASTFLGGISTHGGGSLAFTVKLRYPAAGELKHRERS